MTGLPRPTAIWADQKPVDGEVSPYGCLDCPPGIFHNQIYLLEGNSLCYTHVQTRRGSQIDHEFSS